MEGMTLARRMRTIGATLLSLLILGASLYVFRVDRRELLDTWASLSTWYFLPAFALNLAMLVVRARRWRLILVGNPEEPRDIPFRRVFGVLTIGYLANQIFPAPSGEVTRAVVLSRREGMKTVHVLSTIVVERVFDALAIAPIIVFVLAVIPLPAWLERLVLLAGLALLGMAVAGVIIHNQRHRLIDAGSALIRRLSGSVQSRLAAHRDSFREGLHILRDLRALATVYALSLGAWVLQLAVLEMVTRSLHQPLNLRLLVLLILLSNVGTLLPFAPGNLGTFQALTMTTLAVFHIRPEVSFSIAVAYQMVQFLPVAILGLHNLWSQGLSIELVEKEVEQTEKTGVSS
jgi:uncharacterized protein (TIRG00374 family)